MDALGPGAVLGRVGHAGGQLTSYYRGTLTFAELCSQHNEHRLLFPRLIWLPMAIVAGWDVRHGMVLTFCFVCLGSVGIYKLLGSSNGTVAGRAFVFGLMNLVLFSPRQYETFLVGAQGQTTGGVIGGVDTK
ncbi:MAG TPA: hypothetical protein VF345_02860 [Chthoniobacterales bacterium]